jgi:hypothetical protein
VEVKMPRVSRRACCRLGGSSKPKKPRSETGVEELFCPRGNCAL